MALAEWLGCVAPANVWFGISAEDQPTFDKRWDEARFIPAKIHFISAEPLLGPIDMEFSLKDQDSCHRPGWVIVGGESGPGARPMDPVWAQNLRDQCRDTGRAFFMKQMGGVRDKRVDLDSIPTDLQIREFPK